MIHNRRSTSNAFMALSACLVALFVLTASGLVGAPSPSALAQDSTDSAELASPVAGDPRIVEGSSQDVPLVDDTSSFSAADEGFFDPAADVITTYCSFGPANPDMREVGLTAADLSLGTPTMVFTLYDLGGVPVANPVPPSPFVGFDLSFTGPYSRILASITYPNGDVYNADALCVPPTPTPTNTHK